MSVIYFDNSATTALCPAARERMLEAMDECWANPSSKHLLGVEAEKLVTRARSEILTALGVRGVSSLGDNRLIFTASGTEADNLALLGACYAKKFTPGKKIIVSDSEHPAVLEAAKRLEAQGYTVIRLKTVGGVLDYAALEREVDANTVIVSVMLVNNETGAVNDIRRVSSIVRSKNRDTLVHTDAVQGFMKLKFTPATLGADMITLSAHKIHGPKGVGALYVDPMVFKTRRLSPTVFGGGQEKGFRSGTENTVGIAGFGAAAAQMSKTLESDIAKMTEVRDRICHVIESDEEYKDFALNLPEGERAPHIVSIKLPNIKSETMLHYLSSEGIYVSSGSACSSNTGHISGTLVCFGLSEKDADSTIRVSLCPENTVKEADIFLEKLLEGAKRLVTMKR